MRLPVYLQLGLALALGAVSAEERQVGSTPPDAHSAFMEDGTDVSVCRRESPDNPEDLDTDAVLISVRDHVEQMLASVPAEDSSAVLSALEYQYGEVDLTNDVEYLWYLDEDTGEWVRFCRISSVFAIRASTLSNPIEVVIHVNLTL